MISPLVNLLPLLASTVTAKAPGESTYKVPAEFPSSVFSSYYYGAEPTRQPQPAIYDPVLKYTFPLNLTDPKTIPKSSDDPLAFPKPARKISKKEQDELVKKTIHKVTEINKKGSKGSKCDKCVKSLAHVKHVARLAPERTPGVMVELCKKLKYDPGYCDQDFGRHNLGDIWTQVIAFGDVEGLDGRYMCHSLDSSSCPQGVVDPPTDTKGLFPKPKPKHAKAPAPSGERVKVLHLSDFHLDPRYDVGAESNCSDYLCCRPNVHNDHVHKGQISVPAPLYGAYYCDTPYYLGLGALGAIHPLTGTDKPDSQLGWTVYTGDLVSHDNQNQLSRAYTEYAETSIYQMFAEKIKGSIYPVLGNHDNNPEAINSPHSLPDGLGSQLSWNYANVAGLWEQYTGLPAGAVSQVRTHYGGYSVKNSYGLRMIALNTDFWYNDNIFNFINTSNPDVSGMQHWLIRELQAAEDAGERVWILGHVLTGWDGSNPLANPTDLFYQIVDRYSPHVIANIFFGHTHEDQLEIFYTKNGTTRFSPQGERDALTTAWICPSITPLTNLNSGFRMYEVDTGNFEIYEAYTWYSNVNSFKHLDVRKTGPTYEFEYSTREEYGGKDGADWPADAPLNATFWHRFSEAVHQEGVKGGDFKLAKKFQRFQGKESVRSPPCDNKKCAKAKACYMRSGSAALGRECPQGYGSVQ